MSNETSESRCVTCGVFKEDPAAFADGLVCLECAEKRDAPRPELCDELKELVAEQSTRQSELIATVTAPLAAFADEATTAPLERGRKLLALEERLASLQRRHTIVEASHVSRIQVLEEQVQALLALRHNRQPPTRKSAGRAASRRLARKPGKR